MSRSKTVPLNSGIPVAKTYRMCRKSTIRPPSDSSVNWERISSRPPYPIASLDLNHIGSHTTHAHDFQSPDNIVMVRSTDQRVISQKNGEEPPKLKTVTVNTVETYNRNQNTVRKLTTKSVDGVVESKETIVTDINRAPLLGSHLNLRSEKSKTPLTPVKSQTLPRWGSMSQKNGLAKPVTANKSTSKSTAPSQEVNRDEFQKQCLERHNEYRAKHGVSPLKLNSEISTFAQEWADKLAMSLQMVHRQPNKYGENLWMYMTTDKSHKVEGSDAVDSWYQDELPKYTFETEPSNLEAGHLTQVLWAGSHDLGVGVAKNGFYTFVVCNYNPPGNFLGEFADNVPPIGGWKSTNGTSDASTGSSPSDSKLPSSNSSDSDYAKEMLRIHNEYRSKHGVAPLTLDANISKFAQDWADHLSHIGQFQHRTQNNPYGENIFWSSAKASAQVVSDSWYNEIKDYTNYTVDPFKSGNPFKSGHFTQMVWKSSQKLGVGKAMDKSGAMIVVANYSPQGNYIGQFTANVFPPTKRR